MGKAKFGILGDGKEVAQVAMAKAFKAGDFRSGYYRDQTLLLATGMCTAQHLFAQLYAHADEKNEPFSAGRMMNSHFSTRILNEAGLWIDHTKQPNSSADISPTAGQMARLVGLGLASKLYKHNPSLKHKTKFSKDGNEVAFATIGNGSIAEGIFFESLNASGVLKIPILVSIWDDEYGISVHNKYQIAKEDIAELLSGFELNEKGEGFKIFQVNGWDYPNLCKTYLEAERFCRSHHVPVIIHVNQLTQPLGHSTSGSHERYKPKERLKWEEEHDCLTKMRQWIVDEKISTEEELSNLEKECIQEAKSARNNAWKAHIKEVRTHQNEALHILSKLTTVSKYNKEIGAITRELQSNHSPIIADAVRAMKKALRILRNESKKDKIEVINWLVEAKDRNEKKYNSNLYSESNLSARNIKPISAKYSSSSIIVDGRKVLQACFDKAFERFPELVAFGEDVGKIGDVNKGFDGLQDKYGELRIFDTGIREATIAGQGIGLAMRGLRPIAEIQYLDYIMYALQCLSDDLATLQFRTKGGQKAPLIIRTRGHRLEGMWHAGSLLGGLVNLLRGVYLLVPRNMTQAAGFYNTMLESDDPAVIIECLNGYRLKEKMPDNIGVFRVPVGVPETLKKGTDITIVTYGSMCRIVMEATTELEKAGISCEVIDVQSIEPFDIHHRILESVKKTNRLVLADEDVPGGCTAYMLQKIIEEQGAFKHLDSPPTCITANAHRPGYASDGDYFSKPNAESIFENIYKIMAEANPRRFPDLYE